MRKEVHSLEELAALAQHWLSQVPASERGATVVGLIGNLGSGKTAFTQAVGRELGITEALTSPTFVIQKSYELKGQPWSKLVHIDAYRLQSGKELLALGWSELVATPRTLVLVEWADQVETVLPVGTPRLHFKFINEQTREISS